MSLRLLRRRVAAVCAVLVSVALPAYANNPPRPDGVLYLILVFPLIAIASNLAGVESGKGGWAGRVGRGIFFILVILASAAGTEIGLLAMLVIVIYGLLRSLRIGQRGQGRRRLLYAAVTLLGTLLAGVGYIWAIGSTSASAIGRSRQARTVADMRAVGTAIMSWSMDNTQDDAGGQAPEADPGIDVENQLEVSDPSPHPQPDVQEILFADGQGPPLISHGDLSGFLVPDHIAEVPELDGWGRSLEYRFDPVSHRFRIRSGGGDHRFDGDSYAFGPFDRADLDRDIVYGEGKFICWPQSTVGD